MNALLLALSLATGISLTVALRARRSRLAWIERYSAARHRAERAERERDAAITEAVAATAAAEWLRKLNRSRERRAN